MEFEIGDNLDAINEPQDLFEYERVYTMLATYARLKGRAVAYRLLGQIGEAVAIEAETDLIYSNLPEWAKTW